MDFSTVTSGPTATSNLADWSGGYSNNGTLTPVLTFVDSSSIYTTTPDPSTGATAKNTTIANGNTGLSLADMSTLYTSATTAGIANLNFAVADGDPNFPQVPLSQTINGLTAGASYTVSFYQAASDQLKFGSGPLTSQWTVTLGGRGTTSPASPNAPPEMDYQYQQAVAWEQETLTFTFNPTDPSSTSAVLSFMATGTPMSRTAVRPLDRRGHGTHRADNHRHRAGTFYPVARGHGPAQPRRHRPTPAACPGRGGLIVI